MYILIQDNYYLHFCKLEDFHKYKNIEVIYKNNDYYLCLKDNYYFNDQSQIKIVTCQKYEVFISEIYYAINIYIYENDYGYDDYKLYVNQKIFIACNDNANIVSHDKYLTNNYIYLAEGKIKSNFAISVNGLSYDNHVLKDGELIEYLGLKIRYYRDFLYINNFLVDIKIPEYKYQVSSIPFPIYNSYANYYIPEELIDLHIENIEKFEEPKKINSLDFIKSLLSNLTMSISMSVLAGISYYNSLINNQAVSSRISYILMPISTCLNGIIIPLFFYIHENNLYKKTYQENKNKYLTYLDKYEDDLNNNLQNYLNSINSRYFDLSNFENKMFIVNKNSDNFMQLSIGKIVISKSFAYKSCTDEEINEKLNNIYKSLACIENYPLFLNLHDYKIVTIITKASNKQYFFNKFLLELAYKYHYDDLNIALYSNNKEVSDAIFNLPHLFVNNSRLTLNTYKQLQELDQTKLDKPLVLFIYEHVEFHFSNKNIYIIYFSIDNTDLYKNSEAIIEYLNNKGYLYADKKYEFTYVEKRINFNYYFNYLGKLRPLKAEQKLIHFKDIFSFNIEKYYQNCNNTLKCAFAYNNGEILNFDLHETKQGPHGLIGGCTGSGKSELIVSLLLSLCIAYSPTYLNIVLIDYKGGGLKESLSYMGISLPHICASVSNLENNTLQRLIIALNNECRQRQESFKKLSRLTNTSIMNLDDYLNANYAYYKFKPLPHLLIVVDEFAQLKKENPEQIKELISLARIGRSLGLHLILATQKPGGVIDEEIWSNAHFKIALKLFEEKDSQDLIKRKDAAYLNEAGSFLLQVDDSLIKAKSIYSKTDIYENDPYKVAILDNMLNVSKTYKTTNKQLLSESSVYVQRIIETCNRLNLKAEDLVFLPNQSKNRKTLSNEPYLIFGESDDYLNCKRQVIYLPLNENVLLFSTRLKEINSFLNTFNEYKRQTIVIGKNRYVGPYISDSLLYDEKEDLQYLFNYLLNHKDLNLSLIIDDLSCLLSYDETYLDILCKMARRSSNLNLSLFFISTNSQISYKLINYFNHRLMININDKNDIAAFYGMRCQYEGNSYYFDSQPISMIPVQIENNYDGQPLLYPLVQRIPETILSTIEDDKYLLGYDLQTKQKVFGNRQITVCSLNYDLLEKYQKAYKDICIILYSFETKVDYKNELLWLGPGVFNQRLFVSSLKQDLSNDEALYISGGNKRMIRGISDV